MGRAFEYRKAAKMKRWGNMSRIFPKLGKIITVAAKEGGSDPDMNPKLRTAILNAKAQNMPKDNIEAAIKRAEGKDGANLVEVTYEGKGPHGVMLVVECATDNTTRTVANIKSYFNKLGDGLLPNGAFDFMFAKKSVFEFKKSDDMDLEELELSLIDYGLDEIQEHDGIVYVYGDYTDFGELNKGFEELEIELTKAMLQRVPTSQNEYTEKQLLDIEKLTDKLDEDEDVSAVYTNIA
jgi:YebC/PmpR family DNA-binding regulatory protein